MGQVRNLIAMEELCRMGGHELDCLELVRIGRSAFVARLSCAAITIIVPFLVSIAIVLGLSMSWSLARHRLLVLSRRRPTPPVVVVRLCCLRVQVWRRRLRRLRLLLLSKVLLVGSSRRFLFVL